MNGTNRRSAIGGIIAPSRVQRGRRWRSSFDENRDKEEEDSADRRVIRKQGPPSSSWLRARTFSRLDGKTSFHAVTDANKQLLFAIVDYSTMNKKRVLRTVPSRSTVYRTTLKISSNYRRSVLTIFLASFSETLPLTCSPHCGESLATHARMKVNETGCHPCPRRGSDFRRTGHSHDFFRKLRPDDWRANDVFETKMDSDVGECWRTASGCDKEFYKCFTKTGSDYEGFHMFSLRLDPRMSS